MTPEVKQLLHVSEGSLCTEGQQHIPVTKAQGFDKLHCLMLVLVTSLKGDVDDWF